MRATPDSPRMFESDFVDAFSRTHWSVVPVVFGPLVALLFAMGLLRAEVGLGPSVGLFAAGLLVWSLAEYWLHRTVFHLVPRAPWGERFHFLLHGVHHTWPRDRYRLVMPPAVSISLFFAFGALFYWLLGPRWVWPFHAGFSAGYLAYDMTHYFTHHGRAKTRWGAALKRHHMLHHFKTPSARFGVSSPVWDWVFGTRGSGRAQLAETTSLAAPAMSSDQPGAMPSANTRTAAKTKALETNAERIGTAGCAPGAGSRMYMKTITRR